MWGAIQPVAGAVADRYGPAKVLVAGILLLSLGTAMTPFMTSGFGLIVSLGLVSAIGSGAGSFSVLIGAASLAPRARKARQVGRHHQCRRLVRPVRVRADLAEADPDGRLDGRACGRSRRSRSPRCRWCAPSAAPDPRSRTPPPRAPNPLQAIRESMGNRSYLLLHAGFFTCGFHIAFLVTHLPGEVDLCGLPPAVAGWSLAIIGLANIAGSLIAGSCTQRYRSKYILAVMYGSRALLIGWYLLAPKTELTFYLFAAGLGLTWLATVPPTAAIVGKLFGVRYLATLFGLTLLSHQVGGFLGAYLGGLAIAYFGDYQWMWYADMALAAAAALVNLPIREAPIKAVPVPA